MIQEILTNKNMITEEIWKDIPGYEGISSCCLNKTYRHSAYGYK